jgi:unsaturated chondroitin disaccharide hydrolase
MKFAGRRAGAVLVIAMSLAALRGEPVPMADLIRDDFTQAAVQYSAMLDAIKSSTGSPRTYAGGRLSLVGPSDWTSGFFPGALWYIYEYNGDTSWRDAAGRYTSGVESAKTRTNTHDVGFILNCSFGNGYRLTATPAYRDVLLTGAASLSTRFSATVGCIKSWDNREWPFPVIIDNMMNLELLERAAQLGGVSRYADIAASHADTTQRNHFRADNSSYHVVGYNPTTGAVEVRQTAQGAFDESAWARGQSWGLYGYTMMYRETHRAAYLDQAQKIAAVLLQHPRLPADRIPYWDYDAPNIPNTPRDASAAAITSSALIELSGYVTPDLATQYLAMAEAQLRSLSGTAYRSRTGDSTHFLLQHSTGNYPGGSEIDVPLIYADYYYLEALLRFKARLDAVPPVVFDQQPASQTIAPGTTVVFSAHAVSSPEPTYQWRKDNTTLTGATNATLVVLSADATSGGNYTCIATNNAGTATTAVAALTVTTSGVAGRLTNLSIRASTGPAAQTLITGFVVAGSPTAGQRLLIRGMGPSLAAFGVTGWLGDPLLTLYRTGETTSLATNDSWGTEPDAGLTAATVGAYPFTLDSQSEAAFARWFASNGYTVHLTGSHDESGIALAEIYDATPAKDLATAGARLVNVSARLSVGRDDAIGIAGFVIGGTTAKTVLIRGVGPTLATYGVTGALADPQLRLFAGNEQRAVNDNWSDRTDASTIRDISTRVGAFALSTSSKDAAILVTLPPGSYTAQLSGVGGTTGIGLIEVYEVP